MEKHKFYQRLKEEMEKSPSLRKGQAAFNLMWSLFPNVANKYRGSDIDPFYLDDKTDRFITTCLNEVSNVKS